jgi:putative pyoverdin transport system ATP-binding/permease protein
MKNLRLLLSVIFKWSAGIRLSRVIIILAALTGGISGIGYTALIALVKTALSGAAISRNEVLWPFVVLCCVVPISGFVSQILLLRLTAQASYELRLKLSRQILSAPLSLLEKLKAHRLMTTLNEDIPAVTGLITGLPQLLAQFAMMAGCLIYLGWLSWRLLLCMLAFLFLGVLSYQLPLRRAHRYFELMRESWDSLFKAIRGLTEGTKELKLNRRRQREFLSRELEPAAANIRRYGIWGNGIWMAASSWGQILFFIFIGLLLFLAPHLARVESQVLVGYTLSIIFLITPLTMILNQMPMLERASVAAKKIEDLGLYLTVDLAESSGRIPGSDLSWSRIELIKVSHTYSPAGETGEFRLGPLTLTFYPGELVFLIGGNGSGKTTMIKLLIGLYEPEAGEIRLDGAPITIDKRDNYRQRFSAVFHDFYLFETLFGIDAEVADIQGRAYLDQLLLSHKVQIANGSLSTVDLSQGQRKRLALLNAYLEDRPVYVFDEVASDQDPMFKQVFYYQLVPELKARGKTIIIISHDDRYYHLADRLIKVEAGQIEYDKRLTARDLNHKDVSAG